MTKNDILAFTLSEDSKIFTLVSFTILFSLEHYQRGGDTSPTTTHEIPGRMGMRVKT